MATKKTSKSVKTSKPAKPVSVSQALRQAIAESGRSLYEIKNAAGVDYATLHRFVNADADVRVSTVDALAAALGLRLVKD